MKSVSIGRRKIGGGFPVFVIAEAGVNHNGKLPLAKKLVDAAKNAGADAVKFQTFKAEKLAARRAPLAAYQKKEGAQSQREMLRALELSENDFRELFHHAKKKNMLFLSTPFDEESADFLDSLGARAFKVGSGELTNLPLLSHLAKKKKPVILSTGMAVLSEIKDAVAALERDGCADIVLLHCVSSYPAPLEACNVRAVKTLEKTFHVPCGFSDHTTGFEAGCAAVALGARCIEKHFTLDSSLPGPDHKMSLEPHELARYIQSLHDVEASLGDGTKKPAPCENDVRRIARKSVVSARDIVKGERIVQTMLCMKRPGTGIMPRDVKKVIGKIAKKNIPADTLIKWSMMR